MATRSWTPAQATKSLPLVARIARDIVERGRRLKSLTEKKVVSAEERAKAESLVAELEECMAELDRVGCQYKGWGFDKALIDFPAKVHGKRVLLCWAEGEERVEWYHDEESGFSGRQPIPSDLMDQG